jgi:hypothetical protein
MHHYFIMHSLIPSSISTSTVTQNSTTFYWQFSFHSLLKNRLIVQSTPYFLMNSLFACRMCTDQRIIQSRLKDFEFDVYMRARMAEPFWRQTHIIGWIWMMPKIGIGVIVIWKLLPMEIKYFLYRIRRYDFESQHEETIIQEASQIMHFTVDRDEKYCLVTTKTEGNRLWCLKTITLVRAFFGAKFNDFVSHLIRLASTLVTNLSIKLRW